MKICVAQTKPVSGDIKANLAAHERMITLAAGHAAEMIVFPELSLTGYTTASASEWAMEKEEDRFPGLQELSNQYKIVIGAGMPVKDEAGVRISMLIFRPGEPQTSYSKQYLHEDEWPFFINGKQQTFLTPDKKIAPAICYEIFVKEHAENAYLAGADIYIASVAKTANGVKRAEARLAAIAGEYSMTVLFSNCIGRLDGMDCTGNSAVWNNKGELLAQLNDSDEGILILDTETNETTVEMIPVRAGLV